MRYDWFKHVQSINFRIRIRIMSRIRILLWNLLEKVILSPMNSIPDLHSYIKDTHQILFGSANSFESYCVHMKSPRTYSQTTRQTNKQADRQKDGNFFCLFCLLRHTKHGHSSKGGNFFLITHAITILSLFTYSVCDEKVKISYTT